VKEVRLVKTQNSNPSAGSAGGNVYGAAGDPETLQRSEEVAHLLIRFSGHMQFDEIIAVRIFDSEADPLRFENLPL
jgi:hypothetical protein